MDRHQPTTESETGKKGFFERKRNRVVAATLATVIGVSALAGCESNASAQPPAPTVTHSAEVTPGPTATEATPTPAETKTPVEQLTIPEGLKKYESMSVDEFDKLPIQERLTYVSWLTRDTEEVAGLWYKTSGDPHDQYPSQITETSSNQDITTAADYAYRNAFVTHFNVNGINGESVLYDINTAKKIMSGAFVNGQYPQLQNWDNALDKLYGPGSAVPNPVEAAKAAVLQPSIVESDDTTESPLALNDTVYNTRTIKTGFADGKSPIDITYAFITYKDYSGQDKNAFVEVSRK